ncbi:MAG: GGDEF domain-containing protein [Myxococcota bacterium]
MPDRDDATARFAIDALISTVPVVDEACTVQAVAQAMAVDRAECVVVCNAQLVTGVISEADITRLVADGQASPGSTRRARDIMWPPLTVARDTPIADATALVGSGEARRLVVVNPDGTVAGLVTESDLLRGELRRVRQGLEAFALEDELLGIGNRRAMEADLHRQHKLVERHGGMFSLLLFDIDAMGAFNDRYGYGAGSRALKHCVQTLADVMRASDRMYRFGGASILTLLPQTDRQGALRAAHRMRKAVEGLDIPHEASRHLRVTVSAGAACCEHATRWEQVVAQAERGLALAKQDGRNAVRSVTADVTAAA